MKQSILRRGTVLGIVFAALVPTVAAVGSAPVIVSVRVEGGVYSGKLEIQLNAAIARSPLDYRAWEKGVAEPVGWTPLPAPVGGVHQLPFVLQPTGGAFGSTRVVYLRARNADGESRLGGTRVGLTVPRIAAAAPLGGARIPCPETIFQARIGSNPTEYKVWERGQVEPLGWLPIEALTSTTYLLPHTLEETGFTVGTRRVVYLKARNEVGESQAFPTQILVGPPAIAALSPSSAAAGSSQEILLRGSFGAADNQAAVTFDGIPAEISSWNPSEIRCLVPLGVSGGIVPVVVTSQCGLQSSARRFSVRDFWAHAWTGEFQAESGECPEQHGWLIVTMTRRLDGKVSVNLQDGRVLVGSLVESPSGLYTLDASGSQADGTQTSLLATMDNRDGDACFAEGQYAWVDPFGGTSGGGDFELSCPPADVSPGGVYVVVPGELGCSDCGGTELMPVNLLKLASAGKRLAGAGIVLADSYSGQLEGTTFSMRNSDGRATGIFSVDDDQNVLGLQGEIEWSTPFCDGWDEFEGYRSTGASGAPSGKTCWDLGIESYFGEILDGTAEATVTGNRVSIQLTVFDSGETSRFVCVGSIYDAPGLAPGGFFIAKYSSLVLFGRYDPEDNVLVGKYILGSEDFGDFEGAPATCP